MSKVINLVIPCAGKSKRFFDAGFKTHKAFLKIDKKNTILSLIIRNFDHKIFKTHLIFTTIQKEEYKNDLKLLKQNFPELIIHYIEEHDLGPTYSINKISLLFE